MKKILILFFICSALSVSSQVLLKGAGYVFLPSTASSVLSLSIGAEYKHRQFGYEYMFNAYNMGVDGTDYGRNTHQLAVKLYLTNTDSSWFNIYAAAFVHYKDMKVVSGYYFQGNRYRNSAKGIGYGVLLGNNLDLGKRIGIESGISLFYLSTNRNIYFRDSSSNYSNSKLRVVLRLLLYIKM